MNSADWDRLVESELAELLAGLPDRCECEVPCQERDGRWQIIRCAECGGLVLTYVEVAYG